MPAALFFSNLCKVECHANRNLSDTYGVITPLVNAQYKDFVSMCQFYVSTVALGVVFPQAIAVEC